MISPSQAAQAKRPAGKGPRTKKQARKVESRVVAEKKLGWR